MSRLVAFLTIALVMAGMIAAGCGDDDDDDDEVADGAGAADLEITTTDNQFSTESLTAPADTEVTLTVNNEGSALHNWIVPDEEVTMDLVPGGETGEVTFTLPAGEYEYLCEAHPTDMQGTLVVE
jgi:plastocyanin